MNIVIVKTISALRAELRRMMGVFRFPAALVAAVNRSTCGTLGATFSAELSCIYGPALAGPAGSRPLISALNTEFSGIDGSAFARPAVSIGSLDRCLRILLLTQLI